MVFIAALYLFLPCLCPAGTRDKTRIRVLVSRANYKLNWQLHRLRSRPWAVPQVQIAAVIARAARGLEKQLALFQRVMHARVQLQRAHAASRARKRASIAEYIARQQLEVELLVRRVYPAWTLNGDWTCSDINIEHEQNNYTHITYIITKLQLTQKQEREGWWETKIGALQGTAARTQTGVY